MEVAFEASARLEERDSGMKSKKWLVCAIVAASALLFGLGGIGYAWDHGGHHGFHGTRVSTRVFIGGGFWWDPWWWGPAYPYYYAAPPVVVQQSPPVYVQQQPPQQPTYWYYCSNPAGYYPYVKTCPPGWMAVVPPNSPPAQ